jgi:hypothetical protein
MWIRNRHRLLSLFGIALLMFPFPCLARHMPFCAASRLMVCGQDVFVPAAPIGASARLQLPSPNLPEPFTVKCMREGEYSTYQITDTSNLSCMHKTCGAARVRICGATLQVPGGATVGTTQTIDVPESYLGEEAQAQSFRVRCVDNGDAGVYELADRSDVSCSAFACPSTDLDLCGGTVHVKGGARLGTVLDMSIPQAYFPAHFHVQCLGGSEGSPAYRVSGVDSLTCRRMAEASP